jgi:hypothetical protein
MMDHETDGDGAINLSTSQRPSAATTPNGNIEYDDQDQVSTAFCFLGLLAVARQCCSFKHETCATKEGFI